MINGSSPLKRERHPYGEFIPEKPKAMIIGSFPIGKFSDPRRRSEIKPHEFEFFFGGEKNLLWKILGVVFKMPVTSVDEIKFLLEKKGLAVGDLIISCRRKNGRASDSDLYDIIWNKKLLEIIKAHRIKKIYFTSKKVESWFKKLFPGNEDLVLITLISPSAQSVRSIVKRNDFKAWLKLNPSAKKSDFILDDYKSVFETGV